VIVFDAALAERDELRGRDTGELGPVAAKVSLIEVPAFESNRRPVWRSAHGRQRHCSLKSAHPDEPLGRHPNILGEDFDEPAPAEAQLLAHLTYLDTGPFQLAERSLDATTRVAAAS
jgi:hypothetical protein